jgi:hypothetical protein
MNSLSRRAKSDDRSLGAQNPPPVKTTFRVRKTSAWLINAAVGSPSAPFTITNKNILDAILSVATAATTGIEAFQAFKVHSIGVWTSASVAASNIGQISLEYPQISSGTISGPNDRELDLSLGTTQVSHVIKAPPKDSSQHFWQVSNTNAFVQIVAPVSSLIMIDYSAEYNDSTTTTASTAALVGATIGVGYQLGLDGATAAATKFTPLGYITA